MPTILTSKYGRHHAAAATLRTNASTTTTTAPQLPAPRSGESNVNTAAVWRLQRRRGGGGGGGKRKKFWGKWIIGGTLFVLVLVYVTVVIAVTRSQGTTIRGSNNDNNNARNSNNNNNNMSPFMALEHSTKSHQQILQKHEQNKLNHLNSNSNINKKVKYPRPQPKPRPQQRQENPKHEKDDKNKSDKTKKTRISFQKPFRVHNWDNALNHNVKPQVLLADVGVVVTDNDEKRRKKLAAVEAAAAYRMDPPKTSVRHPSPDYVLTAYLEPDNQDEWNVVPLPVRSKAKARLLQQREYTRVNSCQKLTQQWPVDDTPAEDDPFLPWIHDVFPTADGQFIQFVAQNRRRCRTGTSHKLNHTDILMKMQPQIALFQHVPIQRINNHNHHHPRYRLTTHEKADPDGLATRFICRFKPGMEETLSVFNFDYDWIAWRKRHKATFNKYDGGIKSIHTSQLTFRCPVPQHLQESIRTGVTVQNDWATLFLDLVPIRTPPRYGPPNRFFQPRYAEFRSTKAEEPDFPPFDPVKQWGNDTHPHVLPKIQDSGRWENIPICLPSLMQYENQTKQDLPHSRQQPPKLTQKKHRLVSCIWASAGYTTRGNRFAVNDGQRRLLEWISYNKVIGFDHFYLYDNSGAFEDSDTSLKLIADLFPNDVTYIAWPSQICNNRPNNVDSPGERSSQYAAEASCRLRFGPHVQWIGQFDIDEYLVPMGKHNNILELLDELEKEDTRILSFGSWRAWPRWAFIDPIEEIHDPSVCWHPEPCFHLTIPTNTTMLQAYNCDRQLPGQKGQVMPAEKQLYRPDYVTHHFIHYSTVTKASEMNRQEWNADGLGQFQRKGFPDPRQRFGSETTEALMLHTKAVAVQDTAGYKKNCHVDNFSKRTVHQRGLCRLGIPWPKPYPKDTKNPPVVPDRNGNAFNCFVNEQIEYNLVPRLEAELKKHVFLFQTNA